MTCNAKYIRDYREGKLLTDEMQIKNYYGGQSFRVYDTKNDYRWDQISEEPGEEFEWFKIDEENIIGKNYLSETLGRYSGSYQSCAAIALMYETKNGEAVNSDMNSKYYNAREGRPVNISTGFRLYDSKNDDEYELGGDAAPIWFSLWDFGIKKPEQAEFDTGDVIYDVAYLEKIKKEEDSANALLRITFSMLTIGIFII